MVAANSGALTAQVDCELHNNAIALPRPLNRYKGERRGEGKERAGNRKGRKGKRGKDVKG